MTSTMRAFVLTAPFEGSVQEVPAPAAEAGEVVVDVERVGVCTDVEFLHRRNGLSAFPIHFGSATNGQHGRLGGDGVNPRAASG